MISGAAISIACRQIEFPFRIDMPFGCPTLFALRLPLVVNALAVERDSFYDVFKLARLVMNDCGLLLGPLFPKNTKVLIDSNIHLCETEGVQTLP